MWKLSIVAGALFAFGCSSEQAVETPGFGKADAVDGVADRGRLRFGEAVVAEITRDLQFDGFRLDVGQRSTVSVETTHLGSSAGFDSTLFVYGPRTPEGGYGDSFLDMDDDGGWGSLSKLEHLELDAGEYLIVVGTPDALGRGRYRLLATCESGDCGPGAKELTLAERSQILEQINDECVFQSCDGDFAWYAQNVDCDFAAGQCSVGFAVHLGPLEGVTVEQFADHIGHSETETSSIGKTFTAPLVAAGSEDDQVILDYRCALDGYHSSSEVLQSGRLAWNFRHHLLDCVLYIEGAIYGML